MITKRIIPCLDVKDGKVVKGVQFKNHKIVGDILALAQHYRDTDADELVFYDITASCGHDSVSRDWVRSIAKILDIPFCVAGGIRTLEEAEAVLNAGADKISINSPALENPDLINQMVNVFGQQCVVVGIDSVQMDGAYKVCQYTGDEKKSRRTERLTSEWLKEVADRGAGEVVINCMNQDGMRQGYDLSQLKQLRSQTHLPLIASGGAGKLQDFAQVFLEANVDGALAASVFHSGQLTVPEVKHYLQTQNIKVRL